MRYFDGMILPSPHPQLSQSTAALPRVSARAAILSILAFWSFYFVLTTTKGFFDPTATDQLSMIARRGVIVLAAISLTLLLWWVLRRLEDRSLGLMVCAAFLTAIPVAFAYAAINYAMFYVLTPLHQVVILDLDPSNPKYATPSRIIFEQAVKWYPFIVAWGMLYIVMLYAARAAYAERRAVEFHAQAQAAQLRALRYQINPHFLFNTLNSLSTLVLQKRNEEAEQMIMNLARFFRTSLSGDPTEDIPLADEIQMQRLYLDIERVRFPERLSVTLDVPEQLGHVPVPGLILQPVVENAIKHGVARTETPVTIAIRAREDQGKLHLTVENDATGTQASTPGEGVGLRNVCDRLATRFSGLAGCTYGPKTGGGFSVHLTMPMPA